MFDRIRSFFQGNETLELSVRESLGVEGAGEAKRSDFHTAAAVLLIEMASRDEDIAPAEAEQICKIMEEHLGVPHVEIPALVSTAMAARKEKGKIDEFVAFINQNFKKPQRQLILAMIWRVVIADGKVENFEEKFAVQMQYRFQLTEDEAYAAREMVETGKV